MTKTTNQNGLPHAGNQEACLWLSTGLNTIPLLTSLSLPLSLESGKKIENSYIIIQHKYSCLCIYVIFQKFIMCLVSFSF